MGFQHISAGDTSTSGQKMERRYEFTFFDPRQWRSAELEPAKQVSWSIYLQQIEVLYEVRDIHGITPFSRIFSFSFARATRAADFPGRPVI